MCLLLRNSWKLLPSVCFSELVWVCEWVHTGPPCSAGNWKPSRCLHPKYRHVTATAHKHTHRIIHYVSSFVYLFIVCWWSFLDFFPFFHFPSPRSWALRPWRFVTRFPEEHAFYINKHSGSETFWKFRNFLSSRIRAECIFKDVSNRHRALLSQTGLTILIYEAFICLNCMTTCLLAAKSFWLLDVWTFCSVAKLHFAMSAIWHCP